jgi:phosphatidylinositol kinase/protein kinase (PI-3  family)
MYKVMGGAPDGDNFKLFTQLSCKAFNILRRHSHLLMNLFILMMATGIPELKTIEDVLWLRNCLVLEKKEEEANHYFNKLIKKSLKNTRAKIGDAVHILVHK